MIDSLTLHKKTRFLAEKFILHLPHALIIDGNTGTGVAELARAIAHDSGSTPFIIYPKKKINGVYATDMLTGDIIIEDVRNLYEQTRTRQSNKQVYIFDTASGSLTKAAQNALLKLLEEPRRDVHFIIATHQADRLLPTIQSRCQRLNVQPISDQQTNDIIEELQITDAVKKSRLAFISRGRPALLKRLASDENAYDDRVRIMSDAKVLLSGTPYDRLGIVHKYKDDRANTLTLIDDINYQLQTIIKKQPDRKIASEISKHLETYAKVSSGGNIRLQLSADMLQ
jgi:hypothetical protein